MLTAFTILVLIALFVLLKTFVVVPMREAVVIERLGKFRAVLTPGFHFLIPFFDRIAYRHETREQVIDIPSQGCITRDNIQVEVDGLVYLQVLDPKQASYGIEDYKRAGINLAQTTMRAEIGKLTLGQSFYEREALNETIVTEIDKASDPWGIKVLRYELRNITPSPNVVHTLERQMEAEREKRAEIVRASAEKEATINVSEGERQEDINLSEGEKQRRINVAKGRAEAISIVAEATAEGTRLIAAAVQKDGGSAALKMQLVEEYINSLTEITTKANVSVVPLELAKIQGFFEGISDVAEGVPANKERM
ncbi:MAG: paraslipin [Gemmatimonadetes bacterium]|jgi:regulator of protease activity HflC (stomatin/prohibitin superfamily)|nr:paraslipin [Gemmatimonadota bacterium]